MIVDWLPEKAVANFSIVSGFLTWIVILFWLAKSGWRIQRRYFVEATRTPLGRNGIVWSSALMGAVFFVAGERRPGLPAILAVAMVGVLSAYVDALTHRLPNGHTVAECELGIPPLPQSLSGEKDLLYHISISVFKNCATSQPRAALTST